MHKFASQFAAFCNANLDLSSQNEYGYQSLSVCILDCVYSLQTKYYSVTVPIVNRYAEAYMNGDNRADGDTESMLLRRMDSMGKEAFAAQILGNHQKLGGKKQIPKEAVCYQLARYLQTLGLGVCWLDMGRMNPKTTTVVEGMKFVIMLAFGHPKGDQLRHDLKGFKRKSMEQITDKADPRLEPAPLAPSAVNSPSLVFCP